MLNMTGDMRFDHTVYTEIKNVFEKRFLSIVHTEVASSWFFLARYVCVCLCVYVVAV